MSFIIQTSIEISKSDDPPHIQAQFKVKRINAFSKLDKRYHEEVDVGENSHAHISVEKKNGWADIEYRLNYAEKNAKMIKAWMMTRFSPIVTLRAPGEIHAVSTEGPPLKLDDDINCVKHWDRLFMFQNDLNTVWLGDNNWVEAPVIHILNPENLRRTMLYRRKDKSRLEFAFIWRRHDIEQRDYTLNLMIKDA